ncbi:SRPBCC family protein [Sphingomonas oligophenolica]|uniref:SRPBCC family protein n=1 Tax=Sphingomonas oligophenolica TaxID=301154 RepID=A0ABU9Y827_9SPHN
MSIAPIVQSVTVSLPPQRAFDIFATRMGRWWKPGMTIGAQPHADIVIEPAPGGRWFERDADGAETEWGKVIAWDPPERLLLAWQLDATFSYDPDFETEVEVRFEDLGNGTTRVTLEHRNLERFGPTAQKVAESLGSGWPGLMQLYADLARSEEKAQ